MYVNKSGEYLIGHIPGIEFFFVFLQELWYGKQGVLAAFRAWSTVSKESKDMNRKFELARKHYNKV